MAGSQFSPQNQGSTVIPVWFSGKTDVKCHSSRSCVYFILLQPRGQLSRVVHFLSSNIVLIVHLGFHMEHSVTSFFFFLPVCWYLDDVWFFFFFGLSFFSEGNLYTKNVELLCAVESEIMVPFGFENNRWNNFSKEGLGWNMTHVMIIIIKIMK